MRWEASNVKRNRAGWGKTGSGLRNQAGQAKVCGALGTDGERAISSKKLIDNEWHKRRPMIHHNQR